MKYIRTKDEKIFDIEKIKDEIANNHYYEDYEFGELESYDFDYVKGIRLNYSAVGSKDNDNDEQRGIRCLFSADLHTNSNEYIQADSIEELCDEFVIVNNADKLPYRINIDAFNEQYPATGYLCLDYAIERFEALKKFIGTKEKHDKHIDFLYEENPNYQFEGCLYAAIWTKWGLKYVAKMNEKGEFELL
jgi:hypothetical protein